MGCAVRADHSVLTGSWFVGVAVHPVKRAFKYRFYPSDGQSAMKQKTPLREP